MAGLTGLPEELPEIFLRDAFPRYMGVELVEARPGFAVARLTVTEHMTNIHGITHGGVVFTLADVVLSAASNAHGQAAVALNVNINFLKATVAGDCLTAQATEENLTRRTGLYRIQVWVDRGTRDGGSGDLVAEATGMVYRKGEKLPGV